MQQTAKQKRNAEIIKKRRNDPKKWTYRLLGEVYGLPHTSIIYIWQTYGLKKLSTVGSSRYNPQKENQPKRRIH